MSQLPIPITIRPATAEDVLALQRLAALDSATLPPAPLLVAEAGGALRAAVSLWDGSSIADPFHPSAQLVALLHGHIARARDAVGLRSRLSGALSRRSTSRGRPSPAPGRARWRVA